MQGHFKRDSCLLVSDGHLASQLLAHISILCSKFLFHWMPVESIEIIIPNLNTHFWRVKQHRQQVLDPSRRWGRDSYTLLQHGSGRDERLPAELRHFSWVLAGDSVVGIPGVTISSLWACPEPCQKWTCLALILSFRHWCLAPLETRVLAQMDLCSDGVLLFSDFFVLSCFSKGNSSRFLTMSIRVNKLPLEMNRHSSCKKFWPIYFLSPSCFRLMTWSWVSLVSEMWFFLPSYRNSAKLNEHRSISKTVILVYFLQICSGVQIILRWSTVLNPTRKYMPPS